MCVIFTSLDQEILYNLYSLFLSNSSILVIELDYLSIGLIFLQYQLYHKYTIYRIFYRLYRIELKNWLSDNYGILHFKTIFFSKDYFWFHKRRVFGCHIRFPAKKSLCYDTISSSIPYSGYRISYFANKLQRCFWG